MDYQINTDHEEVHTRLWAFSPWNRIWNPIISHLNFNRNAMKKYVFLCSVRGIYLVQDFKEVMAPSIPEAEEALKEIITISFGSYRLFSITKRQSGKAF